MRRTVYISAIAVILVLAGVFAFSSRSMERPSYNSSGLYMEMPGGYHRASGDIPTWKGPDGVILVSHLETNLSRKEWLQRNSSMSDAASKSQLEHVSGPGKVEIGNRTYIQEKYRTGMGDVTYPEYFLRTYNGGNVYILAFIEKKEKGYEKFRETLREADYR